MSKQAIRPQGAEGISHACTLAQPPHVPESGNSSSTAPVDGFRAAEQWHSQFCANAKAAAGYLFPSLLRQCFAALPETAQGDFLDGVGALLVNFHVIGEPAPDCQDLRTDVALHAMSPSQQDEWAHERDVRSAQGEQA